MSRILVYRRLYKVQEATSLIFFFLYEDELDDYKNGNETTAKFYSYTNTYNFCLSKRIVTDFKIRAYRSTVAFEDATPVSFEQYMKFYSVITSEYSNQFLILFDYVMINWG